MPSGRSGLPSFVRWPIGEEDGFASIRLRILLLRVSVVFFARLYNLSSRAKSRDLVRLRVLEILRLRFAPLRMTITKFQHASSGKPMT